MNFLGKAPINPWIFYPGKIAGYITWLFYLLFLLDVKHIYRLSFGWNDYLGHFLFIFGLIIALQSIFNLGKSTRFGLPLEETIFVTKGLYQISRNPMYVGIILMTLGAMIYIFKYDMFLLGFFSIVTYHQIILAEEKFLENRFGEKYLEFKRKIRRYL